MPSLFHRSSLVLLSAALAGSLGAQTSSVTSGSATGGWDPEAIIRTESFVRPPARIAEILTTPRVDISFTNQSPDGRWFLRATGVDRSDVSLWGAQHIWLAGLAIDDVANRARSVSVSTRFGMELVDPHTGAIRKLSTPEGASITEPVWSPTGTHIAYIANFPAASYAYLLDVASGKSTRLSDRALLATLVTELRFTPDGRKVIAVLVPSPRASQPTHGPGGIEDGPQVRLTDSKALPQPVHNTLLGDPHDKALLEWHTTGQLALIDIKSRKVQTVGSPAMFRSVDASRDGSYFRVTRMVQPFSYLVPMNSFGSEQEIWDQSGKVVHTLASTPLREGGRGGGAGGFAGMGGRGGGAAPVDTARRNIQWNPVGDGMLYIQSETIRPGQGSQPAAVETKVVRWNAPFGAGDTTVLYRGGRQLGNVQYSTDGSTMFFNDSGSVVAVRTANTSERYNLGRGVTLGGGGGFGGRGGGAGAQDSTQGQIVTRNINGTSFVVLGNSGKSVLLTGTRVPGADWYKAAPRPWIDRFDITTKVRERVLNSDGKKFETFIAPLDNDVTSFLITSESPTIIPDVWLIHGTAAPQKLTSNVDAAPEVSGGIVKRIQVDRPRDGTKFWVTVTLPRDWKPGQLMPGVIWFYPREFASSTDYERSKYGTNINTYPLLPSARPSISTKLFIAHGYVHIEPDIPIYGDSGRMNDNYTRDLRENLNAVINAVVDSGYVDREKLALAGHSYGAFSTVNAMTLMPDFKAGLAGDGMYNRTLTPFGFQSERRNFFDAQATYLDMSPFLRANQITGALLLYHSFEDQNTGTTIISSQRMFAALQGLGKPAAMYLYHYEDHWFYTYQSDLDLWARWLAWLDIYLKDAGSKTTTSN